jgi:hypothetical protein
MAKKSAPHRQHAQEQSDAQNDNCNIPVVHRQVEIQSCTARRQKVTKQEVAMQEESAKKIDSRQLSKAFWS